VTDVFAEIRERAPLGDVAERYGITPERGGMVRCPFHDDTHASAKLYPERLPCFTCGKSWDAVALVGELFGLKPIDAARRLSDEFNLALFSDKPPSIEVLRQAQQAASKRAADKQLVGSFDEWLHDAWLTVLWYKWHLHDERDLFYILGDEFTDTFAAVLRDLERVEYMLDCLMSTDIQTQIQFYNYWRNEVSEIGIYQTCRLLAAGFTD
jgi:hypothetical protein